MGETPHSQSHSFTSTDSGHAHSSLTILDEKVGVICSELEVGENSLSETSSLDAMSSAIQIDFDIQSFLLVLLVRLFGRTAGASPSVQRCLVSSVHVLRFQISRTVLGLMQYCAAISFAVQNKNCLVDIDFDADRCI
mmetsp:Transcript_18934/g.52102  ORF Transcript_18934/g.52102 Transcript_18934/m.52102 type:complete len:137 (+) Transcript_18934:102-512(+)